LSQNYCYFHWLLSMFCQFLVFFFNFLTK